MNPKHRFDDDGYLPPGNLDEIQLCFRQADEPGLIISATLLQKLCEQMEEGIRLVPFGGAEVGGLLFGFLKTNGDTVVDGTFPLTCRYEQNPRFEMTEDELNTLESTVGAQIKKQKKLVVGVYRSRTKGDARIRGTDLEIIEAIQRGCPEPSFRNFLMLAPSTLGVLDAHVATIDEGWSKRHPYKVYLDPATIVPYPDEASAPIPFPSSAVLAEGEPVQESDPGLLRATAKRESSGSRYAVIALIVLLSVALGAAGYHFYEAGLFTGAGKTLPESSQVVQPSGGIGFAANREGPVWKLAWDRSAMTALKPSFATLTISDGGKEQNITMSPEDLSSGTIFYTPQTSDLLFKLEVNREGASSIEEHVRVLGSGTGESKPVFSSSSSSAQQNPAAIPPAAKQAPRTPVREFVAPVKQTGNETKTAPGPATLPPPDPATAGPEAVTVLAIPAVRLNAPATPPPTPAPAAAPQTAPVVAPIPSAPVPVFLGAVPTTKVSPKPPLNINEFKVREVQVTVSIDPRGHVTKATPLNRTLANAPLMDPAVRAAIQWVFKPATEDGKAVTSEMTLRFIY